MGNRIEIKYEPIKKNVYLTIKPTDNVREVLLTYGDTYTFNLHPNVRYDTRIQALEYFENLVQQGYIKELSYVETKPPSRFKWFCEMIPKYLQYFRAEYTRVYE